jgi:hypothetical protein
MEEMGFLRDDEENENPVPRTNIPLSKAQEEELRRAAAEDARNEAQGSPKVSAFRSTATTAPRSGPLSITRDFDDHQANETDASRDEGNEQSSVTDTAEAEGDEPSESPGQKEARLAKQQQEYEAEQLWKSRKKHVFILTSAGKPVFTRWGDESDFAELFGVLQILCSMVCSNTFSTSQKKDNPDVLRRITLGTSHSMYFLTEGELQYVMVTRTRESASNCVRQLQLIHYQLMAVLPTISTVLQRSPSYDVRRMFNHGDTNVMKSLIRRMNNEPGFMFRCLQPLGMDTAFRDEINDILVGCSAGESHMWTILLFGSHVVSFISPSDHTLHADDLLLVINFAQVTSMAGGENWAPICLPRFNTSGYLWAYSAKIDQIRGRLHSSGASATPVKEEVPVVTRSYGGLDAPKLVLVQLGTSQDDFSSMHDAASDVCRQLTERGDDLARQLEQCAVSTPIPIDTQVLGPSGRDLLFFMFISSSAQLVTSQLPPHLSNSKSERKALFRHFLKARDVASRSRSKEPLLVYGCTSYTLAVALSPAGGAVGGASSRSTELYLMFLPSVKHDVIPPCVTSVLRFLKSIETKTFMTKATHWPN